MSTLSNIDLKSIECDQSSAEIDHTKTLAGDFARLYNQSDFSDLQLIIESECFYAHRIVLAARSQYFRALLYGGMKESQETNQRIELKDCKISAFKILLQYIYTGKISLLNEKVILSLIIVKICQEYFSSVFFRKRIYLTYLLLFINMVLKNYQRIYQFISNLFFRLIIFVSSMICLVCTNYMIFVNIQHYLLIIMPMKSSK